MASSHPSRITLRPKVITAMVANAIPLVGIAALGWDVTALVTLYWLELAVLMFWSLVRATFAGRPSEFENDSLILGALDHRHVGVPLPWTDVRVLLSTLPVVLIVAPVFVGVWFAVGVVTVGVTDATSLSDTALGSVVLAAVAIFVSEGATTFVEYFSRRAYRDQSAQTAIRGVLGRSLVLFFGGLYAIVAVAIVSEDVATDGSITAIDADVVGILLLIIVIFAKFAFDLLDAYNDRLAEYDESLGGVFGWSYEPPEPAPIETTVTTNAMQLRPDVRGRILGGIPRVRDHPEALVVSVLLVPFAALATVGQAWGIALPLALGAVAVPVAIVSVDHWLRYAGVEYLTDENTVVARDRLFRTDLWRIEPQDESDVHVERDWLDRRLGTSTIVVTLEELDERRLPHLTDPAPILETVDRFQAADTSGRTS